MQTLIQEGITKEFLKSFDLKDSFSPVQLMPDEDPVRLIKCTKGYWVKLDDNSYLRDANNAMVIILEKEVKIGRARYLLNFQEEILEDKIQSLVKRIKIDLEEKVKATLAKMKETLTFAEYIEPEGLEAIMFSMKYSGGRNGEQFLAKKKEAKDLADEKYLSAYHKILYLFNEKDFEQLFVIFEQQGLPMIASFNKDKIEEMELMKKYFSVTNFSETVKELNEKGHIYQFAKFKILTQNA